MRYCFVVFRQFLPGARVSEFLRYPILRQSFATRAISLTGKTVR
jgi:hypothetical protein